jgi:lipoprotein-anchoring transpeptidase ErfK/SrfK
MRRRIPHFGVAVVVGAAAGWWTQSEPTARAQALPWHEVGGVPFSPTLRSIEVTRDDEPVWLGPATTERRGSLSLGARLPIFGSRLRNSQCASRWLLVGPEAWLCADAVRLSHASINPAQTFAASRALPFNYYTVTGNGSFSYANFETAEEGTPVAQLEPGFIVAIRTVRRRENHEQYGLTARGQWVPMRDLKTLHGSDFRGVSLEATAPTAPAEHRGWAIRDARVFTAQGRPTDITLKRLNAFTLLSTELQRGGYLALDNTRWVRARDITWMRPSEIPTGVAAHERWIDIDTERQVLTAYEGSRAVFATLVSTGRGAPSSDEATPVGLYRIWVKLQTTEMSNLELETFDTAALNAPGDGARRYYAIEAVPWVLFFHRGYGLHAALWHDAFGTRRSHGCVNLSPSDAEFLFHWAGPNLPKGFRAVHPTALDPGTWVRVR